MKTAAATADAGQIVETVTRKRVVAADSDLSKENSSPDFWDYLEKLTVAEWEKHLLYIYRRDTDSGPMLQLEKSAGSILLPDGSRADLTSREETEFAILSKYGGGTYRLILKRGRERITEGRIHGEGPRKTPPATRLGPEAYGDGYQGPAVTADATADVAHHAIASLSDQDRLAVNVGISALTSAADVVKKFSAGQGASSPTDELMKQALVVMMQKALNPPDPIESLTKLLMLMKELNGGAAIAGGPGAAPSPAVAKILDTALERMLNPPATGPASVNATAELVRQLPGVAGYVAQALSEWRAGVEAQRDTAAIMRGNPAGPAPPARPPATVLPPPAAPSAPAAPTSTGGNGIVAPSLEFIESKILEMFREPVSADEAADRTVAFLDTMSPAMVDQLRSLGEAGILRLFQSRAILQPAMQNLPRLQDFIRAFLVHASDGAEPPAPGAGAKPI